MNKSSFIRILFFAVPFLLVVFFSNFTGGSDAYQGIDNQPVDTAFEISNYVITAEATSDRQVHIREVIDVTFNTKRASIIRDLPVNNNLEYRDIKVENRAYSVEKFDKFIAVDMDANNYTQSLEPRTYIISYTLDYSKAIKQNISAKDTIPLNIIGHGWPTIIHNADITITLPAEVQEEMYYVGRRGVTTGAEKLDVTKDGNTYNLKLNTALQPYQGVTVGYVMPEGVMHSKVDVMSIAWNILLGAIFALFAYLVFNAFGKDETITPVVNFTPPLNLNSAEMGYLIDGNCSPSDMTSLIFYWASHGHLHIKDEKDGKDIELVKVSELDDGHKSYEKLMFSALFKGSATSVKVKSLKEKFYLTLTDCKLKAMKEYTGKLYNAKASFISILTLIASIIAISIWVNIASKSVSPMYSNGSGYFTIIGGIVLYGIGTYIFKTEPKQTKSSSNLYMFYFLAVSVASFVFYLILKSNFTPLYHSIVIAISFGALMCIIPFIQARTEYYHKMLNEIVGFRNFLRDAEKDRLELMIKDNPQYYYDILPFANVLGVSDIWMNKFKGLTIPPPTYYYSSRPYSFIMFNTAFNRSMTNMTTTMVSRPAQSGSSGGGFGGGGGGFSGGGFGGGGGRSR